MSYSTVEAAVQTLLQALAAFASADVTRGNYQVLDSGGDPYVVLTPGPFASGRTGDWAQVGYDWEVNGELFVRYVGDGSEWTNLETYRQSVVDCIGAYPTLNGVSGVTDAMVTMGRDVLAIRPENSQTPEWLVQPFVVRVHEEVSYDGSGEYA